MKITDITITPFRTFSDRYQNSTPLPNTEIIQTLLTIETDEGVVGRYFGGESHGDQDGLKQGSIDYIMSRVKPMLVGQDPLDRERFWQWLWAAKAPENIMGVIDLALFDLAGNAANMPVYKLMGGCRDRVKAYASTYPNMGSPENYAEHALACKKQGYLAYKIHPYYYMNPATGEAMPGRPSHIEWDIKVCRLVREAVGDDIALMFDPWGTYHIYEEAIKVGRELEKLGFIWYEHPMPEHRVEPYIRLARELDIPILSPEIVEGHVYTRADWLRRGASDMSRIDVLRGGITAAKKTAIVCEAYGVKCEIHMSGIGNLHVIGSCPEDTCEWYERGLLAPGVNYDVVPAYLHDSLDALEPDGYVSLPTRPGLGYSINWDYIEANKV